MQSYQGIEPYIFISYSHKDMDKVIPIVERLDKDGYRIWYDEGITPIETWDDYIAGKIKQCEIMLTFISNNYIGSSNCMDELNYARKKNKKILRVHIEKNVVLPSGAEMRLERIQAVFRTDYKNEDDFFEKLYLAKDINMCGKAKDTIQMDHVIDKSEEQPDIVKENKNETGEKFSPMELLGFFMVFSAAILFVLANIILINSQVSGISRTQLWSDGLWWIEIIALPFFIGMIIAGITDSKGKKEIFDWKNFFEILLGAVILLMIAATVMIIINIVASWIIYLVH